MFARTIRPYSSGQQFRIDHRSDLPALELLGFAMGVEQTRDGKMNASLANIDTVAREQVRKAQDALAHSPVAKDPEMARFLKSTVRHLRQRSWLLPARDSTRTMTAIAKFRQSQQASAKRLIERHFTPDATNVATPEGVIVNAQVVARAGLEI